MTYQLLSQEQLQRVLSTTNPHSFRHNIQRMNVMYKLTVATEPSLYQLRKPNGEVETPVQRITGFLKTLEDEVREGYEIRAKMQLLAAAKHNPIAFAEEAQHQRIIARGDVDADKMVEKIEAFIQVVSLSQVSGDFTDPEQDILTDLADWLADIPVYCRSEAMKFGLPLEEVLDAVMGSNFTKLPSDGIPKHDANGKFLKDMSNFVPPESAIKTILFGLQSEVGTAANDEAPPLAGTDVDGPDYSKAEPEDEGI